MSSLLASTSLWNDLREPVRKELPLGMTHELREHDPIHALRVQGSRPIASDFKYRLHEAIARLW
ncbi:UNVERIFIED_CONTAM: hypothetical protein Slati_3935600 [Sesamum latifolium]|uniref:Uncharacterized protein n=1 Tax=Sesamum latifolium TaxID=2727402 RepID=A0AAW2TN99_9LAMI